MMMVNDEFEKCEDLKMWKCENVRNEEMRDY